MLALDLPIEEADEFRGALDDADVRTLQGLAQRRDVDLDHRIPAMFAIAHAHDARGDADAAAHGVGLFDRVVPGDRDRKSVV